MISENFYTEVEAAELLGYKVSTLRNWSAMRKGPPRVRVGRRIFYRREALLAWLESHERSYGPMDKGGRAKKRAA